MEMFNKVKINPRLVDKTAKMLNIKTCSTIFGFTVIADPDCPEDEISFRFPDGREEVYKLEDLKEGK